jgi:hypothetical protein
VQLDEMFPETYQVLEETRHHAVIEYRLRVVLDGPAARVDVQGYAVEGERADWLFDHESQWRDHAAGIEHALASAREALERCVRQLSPF